MRKMNKGATSVSPYRMLPKHEKTLVACEGVSCVPGFELLHSGWDQLKLDAFSSKEPSYTNIVVFEESLLCF